MDTIGELPPRYSFILNPYTDVRVSKCPQCNRPTHPRKFALLIHIDDWGPLVLGKTCRYCSRCELIIAHQDELEAELSSAFEKLAPEVIGNDYLVLGTMDKKRWKSYLDGKSDDLKESLKHVAQFKKYLKLEVTGGYYRESDAP